MWLDRTGTVANFYLITAIGSVRRGINLEYGYKFRPVHDLAAA